MGGDLNQSNRVVSLGGGIFSNVRQRYSPVAALFLACLFSVTGPLSSLAFAAGPYVTGGGDGGASVAVDSGGDAVGLGSAGGTGGVGGGGGGAGVTASGSPDVGNGAAGGDGGLAGGGGGGAGSYGDNTGSPGNASAGSDGGNSAGGTGGTGGVSNTTTGGDGGDGGNTGVSNNGLGYDGDGGGNGSNGFYGGGGGGGAGFIHDAGNNTGTIVPDVVYGGFGGDGVNGSGGGGGGAGLVQYTGGTVTITNTVYGGQGGSTTLIDGISGGGGGGAGIFMVGADNSYSGVGQYSGGSLNNSGYIYGGSGGAGRNAGTGGAGIVANNAEIINANGGSIVGGDGGAGLAAGGGGSGIDLWAGNGFVGEVENYGTVSGGDGGDGQNIGTTAGTGGTGGIGINMEESGERITLTNYSGAEISGGRGGSQGGRGGAGVVVTGTSTRYKSIVNASSVFGGDGGAGTDSNGAIAAGAGGAGGVGVQVNGDGFQISNGGDISGGHGGADGAGYNGASAEGGVGVAIVGNNNTLSNNGHITGGVSGDYITRANAVTINGSNNTVRIGTTGTFAGNVVVESGSNNTLALGGLTDNDVGFFTVSSIGSAAQFVGFDNYLKTSVSTWYLTGSTTAVTEWTVSAGMLAISSNDNLGDVSGTLHLDGGTLRATSSFSMDSRSVELTDGKVSGIEVDSGATLNLRTGLSESGSASGGGTLEKTGEGTLVLAGTGSYTGGTVNSAGTLRLTANRATGSGDIENNGLLELALTSAGAVSGAITGSGNIANTGAGRVTFEKSVQASTMRLGSSTDTVFAAGGTFNRLEVSGPSVLSGTGVAASSLIFNLQGVGNGDTVLTANGALSTDTSTRVILNNADTTLSGGDTIVLVNGVANGSAVAGGMQIQNGRRVFDITLGGSGGLDLLASLAAVESFRDSSDNYFIPLNLNNKNLQSGGSYLDFLVSNPDLDSDFMDRLDTSFANSLNIGGRKAALALQQLYGSYGAYARQPLVEAVSAFGETLRQQNMTFLDYYVLNTGPQYAANGGIVSGSALASPLDLSCGYVRTWATGFGSWTDQDSRDRLAGYEYNAKGITIGVEYSRDQINYGLAAAYVSGDLDVGDLGFKSDTNIANVALYGSYIHDSGLYATGYLAYGHSWNDYRVNMLVGGSKHGKYGANAYSVDVELGYLAQLDGDVNIIPSVGMDFVHMRSDSWYENVTGNSNLIAAHFGEHSDNSFSIPVGLRLNKMFRFGSGTFLVPEIRAAWLPHVGETAPKASVGFLGQRGTMQQVGYNSGRNQMRFGAGVSGQLDERTDFRLDYNYDYRTSFGSHNARVSVGLSF